MGKNALCSLVPPLKFDFFFIENYVTQRVKNDDAIRICRSDWLLKLYLYKMRFYDHTNA